MTGLGGIFRLGRLPQADAARTLRGKSGILPRRSLVPPENLEIVPSGD